MKKLLVFTVLIALAIFVSGCQQPVEKPAEPEKTEPAPEKTTTKAVKAEKIELFAQSASCFCHDGLRDRNGTDVSILQEWGQSMMSFASKDPYWRAKVSAEIAKFPELADVINEKCARCHMPMASVQAHADGVEVNVGSFLNAESEMHSLAIEGVSCTLCHQILPDNLGKKESFSGKYTIDTKTKKPDRIIFGPFEPVRVRPMVNNVGYIPQLGKHIGKAELCATCHTLYTPFIDDGGNVAGEFPEQTPYLEWLNSKYSLEKPCQSCHMPQAEGVRVSTMPPNLPERSPFFRHVFAGANVQMLDMLGAQNGADKAREMLRSHINLKIVSASRDGDELKVDVKVENGAGHKFPTGFPSRRAWIHLVVTDGDGNVVFESGKLENGRIAGESEPYEPHHDTITSEDDVQIYEAVMVDVNGEVTSTLLRAADYIKDNRIPPKGFDVAKAIPDIAIKGKASEDPDFTGGEDTVSYIINVAGYSGPFEVRAELIYQSVSDLFLKDLRGADTPEVNEFLDSLSKMSPATVIASDITTIP
ncbi:hypothetical protein [Geoglobus acetivorans]|uniref:Cytochrome c family protein n=1 Tax=Geoglobus acetivorans TaxID=565033 RepID=A0A0A7GBE1_GEOAI|nr:cytochrome c family protein [Geoglobus acetivorans]